MFLQSTATYALLRKIVAKASELAEEVYTLTKHML
jgi:hypothetical protein